MAIKFYAGVYVVMPIPHIATFLIVLHAVLGCCFHHAHACVVDCCETPTIREDACPCDGHRQDSDSQNGSPEHHERDDHQCTSDSCVFVKTEESCGQFSSGLQAIFAFDGLGTLPTVPVSGSRSELGAQSQHTLPASPLRVHLWNQVLLI